MDFENLEINMGEDKKKAAPKKSDGPYKEKTFKSTVTEKKFKGDGPLKS